MKEANFPRSVKEVKFGAWSLNPKLQTIFDGEVERELEPLLFKILSYLIINKDEIITRQDLIDDVWCQHYVDDNAINRAMSELRKVLKSEVQRGLVVKTHYRKGYSFFLEPEVVYYEENTVEITTIQASNNTITKKNNPIFIIFTIAVIIVSFFYTYSYFNRSIEPEEVSIESKEYTEETLSWMKGLYSEFILSPDNLYAAIGFTQTESEYSSLLVKELGSGQEKKISGVDSNLYPVGWNSSGTKLIYKSENVKSCKFWEVDINLSRESKYLFDCQRRYALGASLSDGSFIYSKYGYRQKSELSVIVNRNLQTGEEFQITSPNLNSFGDKFLYYIKNKNRIIFERLQSNNSSELYITDLEGGNQVKLLVSENRIWGINYNELKDSILWYGYKDNIIYEFSLSEKKFINKIYTAGAGKYSMTTPISNLEVIAVTYPYAKNVYFLDFSSSDKIKLSNSEVYNSSSSLADESAIYLKINNNSNTLYTVEEVNLDGEHISSKEPPLKYNKIYKNPNTNNEILGMKNSIIHILNYDDFSVKQSIEVKGDLYYVEYLGSSNIGYIVHDKERNKNLSYIYNRDTSKSILLPIEGAVWFDQLSPTKFVFLSNVDKLFLFDTTGSIKEIDENIGQSFHKQLLSLVGTDLYYSNGVFIKKYNLEDLSNIIKETVYEVDYSKSLISEIKASERGLLIGMLEVEENEFTKIKKSN